SSLWKKQLVVPVWQVGPAGFARTSTASASQSMRSSTTESVLPLVSPFFHSACRDRDQKCTTPVSRVSRSASAFIHASMSTVPRSASCTTQGTRPRSSYVGSTDTPYVLPVAITLSTSDRQTALGEDRFCLADRVLA